MTAAATYIAHPTATSINAKKDVTQWTQGTVMDSATLAESLLLNLGRKRPSSTERTRTATSKSLRHASYTQPSTHNQESQFNQNFNQSTKASVTATSTIQSGSSAQATFPGTTSTNQIADNFNSSLPGTGTSKYSKFGCHNVQISFGPINNPVIAAALSTSTYKTYNSAWLNFMKFCAVNFPTLQLPVSADILSKSTK